MKANAAPSFVGPIFVGSEIYRGSSYGAGHPLRVPRVSTVMDLGRALGLLDGQFYRSSPRAKPAALALWHDPDYLAALQEAGVIESTLVKFVTVPLLGIHSTAQGLALQVLAVALVAAGVLSNRRKSMRAGLGAP